MQQINYGYIKKMGNEKFSFKPKVEEYVFELDGVDIENTKINYFWLDVEYNTIENGVHTPYRHKKDLAIEILGTKGAEDASVEIAIDLSMEELKALDNKPTNITDTLIEKECFIKRLNETN